MRTTPRCRAAQNQCYTRHMNWSHFVLAFALAFVVIATPTYAHVRIIRARHTGPNRIYAEELHETTRQKAALLAAITVIATIGATISGVLFGYIIPMMPS